MNFVKKFKQQTFEVESFQEAWDKGYFSGSISFWRLLKIIMKHNPTICWKSGGIARGLWCSRKGFICGMSVMLQVPRHTLVHKKTKKMLARGWPFILDLVQKKGLAVKEQDLYGTNRV